ncbi:MAG: hypothetical protein JWR24_2574 [Actinoallomurus sp.]|nr:hypothetical protein [Actinoallomurus sp.]
MGVMVTDPQASKYGPPFDPNAPGSDQPNPDAGKNLSYLVPNVSVAWSTAPSFNLDPPNSGGGDGGGDVPPCSPIQVNLSTLRGAEASMLGSARTAVGDYQSLRDKVMSVKDTVFGQQAIAGTSGYWNAASQGYVPGNDNAASPIQDPAKKFADVINPAQEKVLWQMAGALEVIGQYVAAVNRAGQSYGEADRKAKFPAPPPNPVTS